MCVGGLRGACKCGLCVCGWVGGIGDEIWNTVAF